MGQLLAAARDGPIRPHTNELCAHIPFAVGDDAGAALDAAEALFAESLDLAQRVGMRAIIGYALIALALTGQGGTDPGWSARLYGAADQALADLGLTLEPLEAR